MVRMMVVAAKEKGLPEFDLCKGSTRCCNKVRHVTITVERKALDAGLQKYYKRKTRIVASNLSNYFEML